MNIKNNKNYQNSQLLIENAFFSIIEEKKTNSKITVRDICLKAKINRSTFYRHFLDVDDLTSKIFLSLQEPCFKNINKIEDFILSLLDVIENNKSFFNYALNNSHMMFANALFKNEWNKTIVPIFKNHGVHEERIEYYFAYITGGLILIIKKWIDNNYQLSKDEIYNIIIRCINSNTFINQENSI